MRKLLVFLFLLPCCVNAQNEYARELVKTLCSPEFHGRGYVNGGDSIAAEFIAAEFRKAGCQFFEQGVFQPFTFQVNTFPNQMKLTVNGKTLQPGIDFVVDPASGGGNRTAQRLKVIALKDAISSSRLTDEINRVASQKDPETGKQLYTGIIVNLSGTKGDTLQKLMQAGQQISTKMPVILVTDTKFTWSVSENQGNYPLFLVQSSALDLSQNITVDYSISVSLKDHTARNVIAYIPAKKKSSKYIVYTAHYDHLGRMGQETYFPGGNDNASGTAMLIELARHFSKNPMDVNVVFMAFAGEEAGLIGSHYYVEHPYFPLEKIHFLTNIDIMGSGEEGITVVNATLFPKQFEVLTKMNATGNFLVKVASRGPAANSDHYFFTQAGVPAFFLYTMGPNKHYHDVYDTYEELSFAEFSDIFRLLVEFGTCLPRK